MSQAATYAPALAHFLLAKCIVVDFRRRARLALHSARTPAGRNQVTARRQSTISVCYSAFRIVVRKPYEAPVLQARLASPRCQRRAV